MAVSSVNGSSSSAASSIYGSKNILSGLASGLDTETMIENMLEANKTRVQAQEKKIQKLSWQQEAYQSISDKLVELSTKYTSFSSTSNLMSKGVYTASSVTARGINAELISATGTSSSDIKIAGVSQLSQNETITFAGLNGLPQSDSKSILGAKTVDLSETSTDSIKISNVAGQELSFKYGNKSFSIALSNDETYNTLQEVADEINKQLGKTSVSTTGGGSITMDSKITASVKDGKMVLELKKGDTNSLTLQEGSSDKLTEALGLKDSEGKSIKGGEGFTSKDKVADSALYTTAKNAGEVLAGTSMKMTYNGKTATITMPKAGDDALTDPKKLTEHIQSQLNQAFGYNRVSVSNQVVTNASGGSVPDADKNKLQLKFSVSGTETLSIDSGSSYLVGKNSLFGIERNAANRVNVNSTLGSLYGEKDTSLYEQQADGTVKKDADGNPITKSMDLTINGVKIGTYDADTTLSTILNDINNNTEAGVKVSFSKTTNQFVFSSLYGGAGGKIEMTGTKDDNLAVKLFGQTTYGADGKLDTNQSTNVAGHVTGQDAKMIAIINGTATELTSESNAFVIDGMTVSADATFGAQKIDTSTGSSKLLDASGAEVGTQEYVSFSSKVDSDNIISTVKSFIEDYNTMLKEVNSAYTTQPSYSKTKTYEPLTDDQKADMTDKQIEEYEKKAKQGLLFNSSELGSLRNSLRSVFSSTDLSKMGISVSTSTSSLGQLTLDESALRASLEKDANAVAEAFAGADGNGAFNKLKTQLDRFAGTTGATKGVLIEKAGSKYSPTSMLKNSLQTSMDTINDYIDTLNDKINDQIDRYTAQFTRLETLINKMNAQSSYFAGMSGY